MRQKLLQKHKPHQTPANSFRIQAAQVQVQQLLEILRQQSGPRAPPKHPHVAGQAVFVRQMQQHLRPQGQTAQPRTNLLRQTTPATTTTTHSNPGTNDDNDLVGPF
uniref:(northern house mosquito) hypothetical protein n=1 Tax=Culex pipiens TaxID=7175 RepID=A0A8D8N1C1_CULPI